MAKQNALGSQLYVAGYDLSGDISALTKLGGGPAVQDVTGIDKTAVERLDLQRSGEIGITAWFNPSAAQEHAVFSLLPTADVLAIFALSQTLGDMGVAINAKQMNYDPTRAANGAISESIQLLTNGRGVQYGKMLTAGKRTDVAAGVGTAVDLGAAQLPALAITSVGVANPGVITTTLAHNMVTGESVTIAGCTTTPSVNGDWPIIKTGANTFTIPVNVTIGAGAAGTVQPTSYDNGLSLYAMVFSFTGTSITLKIQHSADNGVTDAYADIVGATTGALTAIGAKMADTATALPVKRWLKLTSVGTFNPCTYALLAVRHPIVGTI